MLATRHDPPFFRRPLLLLLTLLILAGTIAAADKKGPSDLVLIGAKVYPSPSAAPIENAVIVIRDGKIVDIGPDGRVKAPKGVPFIDCGGKVITAGFWNSHVHFTEDVWNGAASASVAKLEPHMQTMLTSWGFTSVFDIGSDPRNTVPLRERVNSGEIPGPKIYTTAGNIFPKNGIPVYVPADIAKQLTQLEAATPADAERLARQSIGMGADGIKVFTGAIMGHGKITPMPANVARAAVDVAHASGKPVFAHPSNHEGVDNALAAGVDILAHTIPIEDGYTKDELATMKAQHTALIPTLTLWEVELEKDHAPAEEEQQFVQKGVNELETFFDQGNTVLFGTDVGYTQHYDTTEEYVLMAKSGMKWQDILASLTTNPATFFKAGSGELVKGSDADLVVLSADPATDVRNFAKVNSTMRAGRFIYKRQP
jgi:imidazolonepropionase-like amidohydrolase